jgi:hypothetical protein
VDTDPVYIIGGAYEENSDTPEIRTTVQDPLYNYTQIFRRPFGLSRTQKSVDDYGGGQLAHLRKVNAIDFRRQVEKAFIFGTRADQAVSGVGQVRSSGGLVEFLTANDITVGTGGDIAAWDIDVALEQLFEYGSSSKLLIAGYRLVSLLNAFARNKLEVRQGAETFGVRTMNWVTPHGELNIVSHKDLKDEWLGNGFVLDMEDIYIRPLSGNGESGDIHLETAIEAPGRDGTVDAFIAELGFEIRQQKHHGIIRTVAGDVAIPDAGWV